MLNSARAFFTVDPMYLFAPGIALFIVVLAFNLFGDGLRDALDPRLRT
jgi:ABC-type dipeptide/oligopeptide/nickel transport system permease subunit